MVSVQVNILDQSTVSHRSVTRPWITWNVIVPGDQAVLYVKHRNCMPTL